MSGKPQQISDEDVMEAMRAMQGYVDISPGAFREIYELARAHTEKRTVGAMRAHEIMTVPVHCVKASAAVLDAADFLADQGISGAPVLDEAGRVCGVISVKDFLRALGFAANASSMRVISRYLRDSSPMPTLSGLAVRDVMSAPAITGSEEMLLGEISSLFSQKAINRLPICDAAGHPLGIVSRADLVAALSFRG